jgi:hypothetical protein
MDVEANNHLSVEIANSSLLDSPLEEDGKV